MQKLVFFTSVIVTLAAAFGISIQPGINSWFETATEAGSPLFEHASPEPQSVSFYGEDVDPEFALLFESMTDGRDELAMSELPEENTSVEFGDPEPMSTFCSTSDNESICSTGEGLHVLCSVVSLSVSSLLRCSALGTESTGSAAYCSTTDYGQSGNKCSILLVWSGAQRCSTNLHRCSAEGFKSCSVYDGPFTTSCSTMGQTPVGSNATCSTYSAGAFCSVDGNNSTGVCTTLSILGGGTCSAINGQGRCSVITVGGVVRPPDSKGRCR